MVFCHLDAQWLKAQQEFERPVRSRIRQAQAIGKLKKTQGRKQAGIAKVAGLKETVKQAEGRAAAARAAVLPLLLQVPQPPDGDVPIGKDASDNVVAYKWGEPRKFDFTPKNHIELGEKLGLLDFARGSACGFSIFFSQRGQG